ncbi:MAG TPA: hypothetical protein PK760_10685, partial [Flavobacteriales bacterium]|nr:hypothetical protein [Flavobacteriales bacterium]
HGKLSPVLHDGSGVFAGLGTWKLMKARQDLDDLRDDYTQSADPGGIRTLKSTTIPDANDALRRARTMAYVSGGLFVMSAGLTAYLRLKRNERKPPVFDDQEKVRFDGLVWVPSVQGGGTWAMGFTLPIR